MIERSLSTKSNRSESLTDPLDIICEESSRESSQEREMPDTVTLESEGGKESKSNGHAVVKDSSTVDCIDGQVNAAYIEDEK